MTLTARALGLCVAVALLSGCSSTHFATAEELFDAAGGEAWCGGGLSLTVAPWIGKCGPVQARVVIGIAVAPGELQDSLRTADEGLAILVPEDPNRIPGWQLRTQDRSTLEAAQEVVGGVILDDEAAVAAYLGDDVDAEAPA